MKFNDLLEHYILAEIAPVYNSPSPSGNNDELDSLKQKVLSVIYQATQNGKLNYLSPSGHVFTHARYVTMISDAKTKQQLQQVVYTLLGQMDVF